MSKRMEKDGESEINRERRRERQGRVKKRKKSIGPLHYHTLLASFATVSVCHNSR